MTKRLAFTLVAFLSAAISVSAAMADPCPLSAGRLLQRSETERGLSQRESLFSGAIQSCPDKTKPYPYAGRDFERSRTPGDGLALQISREALRRIPVFAGIVKKATSPNQPSETFRRPVPPVLAESAPENGKTPQESSIKDLLTKEPKDVKERLALAKELTRIGESRIRNNQPGGQALLVRAVELVPAYERPRKVLSGTFQELGAYQLGKERFKKAVDLYQQALKYVPDDPTVLSRIANAYRAWGGHEKEELSYLERMVSALETGRPGPARVAVEEEVAQGNRAWEVGRLFLGAADYANASRAFKVALAWIPDNALLHFDLAIVLTRLDGDSNTQAALNYFKRSQALFRENPPPDAAGLTSHFQRRLQIEIDSLIGKTNSWGYLVSKISQMVREKTLEFALFLVFIIGVSGYLLRAGSRFRESTKN